VRWESIILLSNNCTKNYYNRTPTIQVMVEDVVTWIFLKHSVHTPLSMYPGVYIPRYLHTPVSTYAGIYIPLWVSCSVHSFSSLPFLGSSILEVPHFRFLTNFKTGTNPTTHPNYKTLETNCVSLTLTRNGGLRIAGQMMSKKSVIIGRFGLRHAQLSTCMFVFLVEWTCWLCSCDIKYGIHWLCVLCFRIFVCS